MKSLPLLLLPFGFALAPSAWAQNTIISPVLSPDGTRLAFARQTAKGSRLFVGNWDGKTVSRVRTLAPAPSGDDIQPAWRPDGVMIAFASSRGTSKRYDLFVVRPDGTELKRLTSTPKIDETAPSWSPRRFTVLENAPPRVVVDRKKSAIAPSELQLIQKLAGDAKALEKYSEDAYAPTFGVKATKKYYKLLAGASNGSSDSKIITLRDDGSDRRTLEVGMPGFYSVPRFDSTGNAMAFLRSYSSGDEAHSALYFAAYPLENEGMDDKGNSTGMQLDLKQWRGTLKRLIDTSPNAQVAFSPNGETLAVAADGKVALVARPDTLVSKAAPKNMALPAGTRATGLFFASNGKRVFVPSANGTFASLVNPDSLSDVSNLLAFAETSDEGYGLNAQDRPLLARNSFIVGGQGNKQMFVTYEETDYRDLPVFVTSDSLLHLNHLVFDAMLRETETKNLLPVTIELTKHYLQTSIQQSRSVPATLKADAIANVAYWSVVARLLRGEVSTGLSNPPASTDADDAAKVKANRAKNIAAMNNLTVSLAPLLAAVPPDAKKLADGEIALIKGHKERAASPIFGGALTGVGDRTLPLIDTRIDYSLLSPRGHYTRTEALRRYFLATRFLSGAPFRTIPAHLRRALLLISATDAQSQKQMQTLARVMGQFVGQADDRRFLDFVSIARGIYGPTIPASALSDKAKLTTFGEEVDKLPKPRIAPSGGPAMTLFPAPYTMDSEAMQNLVYDRQAPDVGTEDVPRFFALGLDAMGVLGSNRARNLLDTFTFGGSFFDFGLKESGYENYDKQFKAERAKMDAVPESEWKKSFYAQMLWSLRPLLTNQSNPKYKFTQNGAWTDKQLQSALGAWAELKHDTLPKQPVAIEAGGEGGLTEVLLEEQPQGFVEPSPEVYKRLRELVSAERVALAGAGYLSKESNDRLEAFGTLLDMVMKLEAKQSAGTPFTPGEVEQLRFFGTFLEHITLISTEGQAQTMEDNDMAIIADVATGFSTVAREQRALEEGVGHALPIYVAFERNGRRQMARGATYSYYEFTQPVAERLTDSAWQEMVSGNKATKMPDWTKSFVSRVTQ